MEKKKPDYSERHTADQWLDVYRSEGKSPSPTVVAALRAMQWSEGLLPDGRAWRFVTLGLEYAEESAKPEWVQKSLRVTLRKHGDADDRLYVRNCKVLSVARNNAGLFLVQLEVPRSKLTTLAHGVNRGLFTIELHDKREADWQWHLDHAASFGAQLDEMLDAIAKSIAPKAKIGTSRKSKARVSA